MMMADGSSPNDRPDVSALVDELHRRGYIGDPYMDKPETKPDPNIIASKHKLSELKMKIINMSNCGDMNYTPSIVEYLKVNISGNYPKVIDWFFSNIFGENTNDAMIIILLDKHSMIKGIAILSLVKTKICTLFISKEYRGLGAGAMLLKASEKIFKVKNRQSKLYVKTEVPEMRSFLTHMGLEIKDIPGRYYLK